MPKIRFIFGEEHLPIIPSPLNIEEEGDSWWSGVYLNAVAIPITSALAAITLSASLVFGYQQQTEDIVPQPPAQIDDDSWQVYTPPYLSLRFIYLPDPEEIPAGSLIEPPPPIVEATYIPIYRPRRRP